MLPRSRFCWANSSVCCLQARSPIQVGATTCKQWQSWRHASVPRTNKGGSTRRSYLMNTNDGRQVLAFAVDAAEPTLIRAMIEQNEMPTLKSLLSEGRWMSVKSPADIGSGSVWVSFLTGEGPTVHGVYGEWCWEPEQMRVRRVTGRQLIPFWKRLAENGTTLGILDVPFMPLVGLSKG